MNMHAKDFENFLSLRISQLRHQKGVSAREMSLAIGQSENYISRIESKRMLPSMLVFFYICEYFGIHPKEFFDEKLENPGISKEKAVLHEPQTEQENMNREHINYEEDK